MGPKQWGQCRDPHMSWSYIQCYTTHSKWIPYTQVSIGFMWSASSSYNIILSARSSAFPYKTLQVQVKTFSENINHSAVHSPTYKAGQVTQQKLYTALPISCLQGRVRCPSIINHNVSSQACISHHLFHLTGRLTLILSILSMSTCLYSPLLLPSLLNPCQQDGSNSKPYDTLRRQAKPKLQLELFASNILAHFVLQSLYSFV